MIDTINCKCPVTLAETGKQRNLHMWGYVNLLISKQKDLKTFKTATDPDLPQVDHSMCEGKNLRLRNW